MAQQHSGAIRVSLACVQCRSRHLRCDAVTPICARCVREGSECTYLKSRRGGRARAKRDGTATTPESPSIQAPAIKAIPRTLPERESQPSLTPDHSGSSSTSASSLGADDYLGWFPESDSGSLTRAPLLELYYTYFHPAQPCALPLRYLRQKASEDPPGIRLLVNVMQFIGSLYAPKVKSGPLEDLVKASLAEPKLTPNGFEVQALVLYSIAVYWCDEIERARELLDEAIRKAIAIRMNFREFATEHSGGDAVLAESWRRTWWQLYSTDAHIASSNHVAHFATSQRLVPCTVELPCEEEEYCSGVCLFIDGRVVGLYLTCMQ
jgi:Fungal Zn(2)-Cys(6) binuclear cluster domain/Fungal specific transcription factor domain